METERKNRQGARDGRSLDHATLEQLRLRAFERVEASASIASVARTLGFDPAVVSRWVSRARREGAQALHAKPIPGRPPSLDDRQVALIRELILQIPASFWGFASELWTRAMVAHVIERVFGVELSERAVGQIMRHRMGLTPQRPVRRAFECDPEWGRQWTMQEYPRIRARADKLGARIYFADEAAMSWDYHSGTTWAPKGKTPVVGAPGQRMKINLISAISPDGELRWMEVDGSMTAERFIEFLSKLIKGRRKPVFVIVDGHPTHRAKAVTEFVAANAKRLELYFVPSYSPHLNPDEQVWNHLKHHTLGKRGFHLVEQLQRMVHEHMEWMKASVNLVRSFFGEPHCRYASLVQPEELPLPP